MQITLLSQHSCCCIKPLLSPTIVIIINSYLWTRKSEGDKNGNWFVIIHFTVKSQLYDKVSVIQTMLNLPKNAWFRHASYTSYSWTDCLHLSTFTAEFICPVLTSFDIFLRDGRSCTFDRLYEILKNEGWLQELVRVNFCPGHLHRTGITWGTGGQFLHVAIHHLFMLACPKRCRVGWVKSPSCSA